MSSISSFLVLPVLLPGFGNPQEVVSGVAGQRGHALSAYVHLRHLGRGGGGAKGGRNTRRWDQVTDGGGSQVLLYCNLE